MTAPRRRLSFALVLFAVAAVAGASASFGQGSVAAPTASATPTPVAGSSPAAGDAAPTPHGPKVIWSQVRVSEPYIAMTFDDGPSATLTPKLLDILKARDMHVTFFVVGENAKAHPEILKREIAEGHEIGNHSWSHPNFAKMSDDAVRSELGRTSDAIEAAIGKRPTLMRPPYGSFTKAQAKWFHDDLGFTVVLWEVDPNDWKRPGPAIVEQRILEGTHRGAIILSHDIHPGTIEAMPDTFDQLLAKGYKFVTVSQLIAMNEPEPSPTPRPSSAPVDKAHPPKPTPAPRPTRDPSLPDKINGTSGGMPD